MPKQVGLRFDDADFERFKALAKADDRKMAAYMKRALLKQLPILEAEQKASVLNEPPGKYAAKPRPKTPRSAKRDDRN